jgi:hypothetical protein
MVCPAKPAANVIVPGPASKFAESIASRRLPAPLSAAVVTT